MQIFVYFYYKKKEHLVVRCPVEAVSHYSPVTAAFASFQRYDFQVFAPPGWSFLFQ